MFGRKPVSDKDLLKTVNQKLARTGTSSNSRVSACVRQGSVTLSGAIQHEIQRSALVKAASRVEGVRQVFDQMELVKKEKC
jgi:osmotically-inducible protein OsmY